MDTLVMKKVSSAGPLEKGSNEPSRLLFSLQEGNDIPSCDLSGFIRPGPVIVASLVSKFYRSAAGSGPIVPETQVTCIPLHMRALITVARSLPVLMRFSASGFTRRSLDTRQRSEDDLPQFQSFRI